MEGASWKNQIPDLFTARIYSDNFFVHYLKTQRAHGQLQFIGLFWWCRRLFPRGHGCSCGFHRSVLFFIFDAMVMVLLRQHWESLLLSRLWGLCFRVRVFCVFLYLLVSTLKCWCCLILRTRAQSRCLESCRIFAQKDLSFICIW